MKKQLMVFGVLLFLVSQAGAAVVVLNVNGVVQRISESFEAAFGQDESLFDKKIVSEQNRKLMEWAQAIDMAKNFVIDNSKNLIGIKDSDLITAIERVDEAKRILVNAIKVTRGLSLSSNNFNTQVRAQINIFSGIDKSMKILADQIKSKSFTLDKKKDAQRVTAAAAMGVALAGEKAKEDAESILPKA